jgi:hypothetical protein
MRQREHTDDEGAEVLKVPSPVAVRGLDLKMKHGVGEDHPASGQVPARRRAAERSIACMTTECRRRTGRK